MQMLYIHFEFTKQWPIVPKLNSNEWQIKLVQKLTHSSGQQEVFVGKYTMTNIIETTKTYRESYDLAIWLVDIDAFDSVM